ncbi:MAG: hypothetical protein C4327_06830 [Meiothermus sp.]
MALEAVLRREALPAFRVRLLAVEIAAREALGEALEGIWQTSALLLANPGVAALESLGLCGVLIRVLQATGEPEKARQLLQDSRQQLDCMAATLAQKPSLQRSFSNLCRDLLG